jgi:hypothetical protein
LPHGLHTQSQRVEVKEPSGSAFQSCSTTYPPPWKLIPRRRLAMLRGRAGIATCSWESSTCNRRASASLCISIDVNNSNSLPVHRAARSLADGDRFVSSHRRPATAQLVWQRSCNKADFIHEETTNYYHRVQACRITCICNDKSESSQSRPAGRAERLRHG